jgi:hypothetical protein
MSISRILGDLWDIAVFIVTVVVPALLALLVFAVLAFLLFAALRATLAYLLSSFRTASETGERFLEQLVDALVRAADWLLDATGLTLATLAHGFFRRAGERGSHRLFRATPRQASQAAIARSQFVRANLERAYQRKIVEVPPGLATPFTPEQANLDRAAALAQVVRLEYQLSAMESSPELLLFARVTDALTCILRGAILSQDAQQVSQPAPTFDVSLRRLPRWERRGRRFDWIAVVGTDHRELFRAQLLRLQDWLGIGVDFAGPLDVQLQRSCQQTPDNLGTVAGCLRSLSGRADYALTCAHVIPSCEKRRFATLKPGSEVPDAALLKPHTGCLTPQVSGSPLRAATVEEIKTLHSDDKLMRRVGGHSWSYQGWVSDRVASYPVEKLVYEFPACIVKLKRNWYGPVLWPLFRRRFTKKGDSGSWVVVPPGILGPEEVLLGMVHAGGVHGSYVILAQPLIDYFERLLRTENEPVDELLAAPYKEN